MAMTPEALSDFEKMIVKARQKDLPFGLCLGKKPEDNVMVLDLKKSPTVLMRQAKQDGETGKVTCGTLGVKGKIMSLTLEHKMLPGLAKNMKMFFTKNKLKMKVVILDPSGNVLESEDDDELPVDGAQPEAGFDQDTGADSAATSDAASEQTSAAAEPAPDIPPPPPPPPPPGDEASAVKWMKLSTELDPRVKAFAESGHPKAAAIVKAWEGGQAAAEKGNFKVALAVAEKIKPVVTAPQTTTSAATESAAATDTAADAAPATPPETAADPPADPAPDIQPSAAPASTDPNAAKWAQIEARVGALYLEVMKLNPPDSSKLRTVWMAATESAQMNDFTKAVAIGGRIEPMLQAARTAAASAQNDAAPPSIVPFQKSKLAWESARAKMKSEVDSLVEAIKAACAGDEDLKEIADNASDLHKHLETLDDRLDDALNAVINAPAGPPRDSAKQDAVKAIATLQAALSQPFFQDVDSNNGFKPVKVTETAMKSLSAIAKIMAAEEKSAA